ncbi:MAG: sulfatase [Planctomycetota bacterium]
MGITHALENDMRRQPNILICTWHDTGRWFGCYGHETVQSPNVDALAADGWRFDRCFCTSAKCSPSRGSLMTGRYPQSNGLHYLCHGNFGWRLKDDTRHMAAVLGERGYRTVLHGFHHECPSNETARLGHHEAYNHLGGNPTWPVSPCDVIADGAADWLRARRDADTPFFMQLGFFETHRAYEFGGCQPDDERGVEQPAWMQPSAGLEQDMAGLQGSIKKADAAVGTVLQALEECGQADDTIVLFTVDHGIDLPRAKGTCFEPGVEVACVLRWPAGGIAGGRASSRLISQVDVLPTLCELAGLETPPQMDGISFADEFGTPRPDRQRRHIFTMIAEGEKRAVRDERYKLIRYGTGLREYVSPAPYGAVTGVAPHYPGGQTAAPALQLYDLERDPLEQEDLAADPTHVEIRQELDTALWQWMEQVGDPLIQQLPHDPRWRDQIRDYLNWRHERDVRWAGRHSP